MVERYAHVDDAELARAVRVTHAHTDAATKTVTADSTAAAVAPIQILLIVRAKRS